MNGRRRQSDSKTGGFRGGNRPKAARRATRPRKRRANRRPVSPINGPFWPVPEQLHASAFDDWMKQLEGLQQGLKQWQQFRTTPAFGQLQHWILPAAPIGGAQGGGTASNSASVPSGQNGGAIPGPGVLPQDDFLTLYRRVGGFDGIMNGLGKVQRMARMLQEMQPLMKGLFGAGR